MPKQPSRAGTARTAPATAATPLPPADEHVENFQQAREARRWELVEDYVELIDDLITSQGRARQVDLASRLGVSQPTVARMIKRMAALGLVRAPHYGDIALTADGEHMANASRERHQIVEAFLRALDVPPDAARRDAEGIEHHVSPETLAAFIRFLQHHDGLGPAEWPPSP